MSGQQHAGAWSGRAEAAEAAGDWKAAADYWKRAAGALRGDPRPVLRNGSKARSMRDYYASREHAALARAKAATKQREGAMT